MFAATGLRKEGLEGSTFGEIRLIRVGTTIGQQTVLEEVPEFIASVADYGRRVRMRVAITYSSHALLPSCVPAWPIWRWQICRDMLALLAHECPFVAACPDLISLTLIDPSEALPVYSSK
jgi:hypothetical protein